MLYQGTEQKNINVSPLNPLKDAIRLARWSGSPIRVSDQDILNGIFETTRNPSLKFWSSMAVMVLWNLSASFITQFAGFDLNTAMQKLFSAGKSIKYSTSPLNMTILGPGKSGYNNRLVLLTGIFYSTMPSFGAGKVVILSV